MSRWAAVLAGGSGTRFWPLSTPSIPKQLLPLAGPEPLLVSACRRLQGLIPAERILVITAAGLVEATRQALPHLDPSNILGEPAARSTGPALSWATMVAASRDPEASILSMHADWFVGDDAAFQSAAQQALDAAERFDMLVTVGIVPARPDVGYGYIQPGAPIAGEVRRVERFIEKPGEQRARDLIAAGALWNSGLFAWTVRRFVAETRAVAPEIAIHLPLLEAGNHQEFFKRVPAIAVDVSHFERSRDVAVVPGRFPWDDVGNWSALGRVRPQDAAGNTAVGDVFQLDSTSTVVRADDGPVVTYGVNDLVVVRAHGVTPVTTKGRAAHLKSLLDALPSRIKERLS